MMPSEQLIIGNKYKSLLEHSLNNVIWIPDNPYVDERLSGHADLSVFCCNKYLYAQRYLEDYLKTLECTFIDETPSRVYPKDAIMNACSVGNSVFLNRKSISKELYNNISKYDYNFIYVRQGYCRCNILPVGNSALITSDPGIYREASKNKLDVLLISPGYIDLEGFDYGFIGGSGFKSNECIVFTGKIDHHPDYDAIRSFCLNYHLGIEYLTERRIFDVGGIIKING